MCRLSIVKHTPAACGHSMMHRHSCEIDNEIVCSDEYCQIERFKVSYCCYLCNERFQYQADEYEKQQIDQKEAENRKEELERVQIKEDEVTELEKRRKASADEDIGIGNV